MTRWLICTLCITAFASFLIAVLHGHGSGPSVGAALALSAIHGVTAFAIMTRARRYDDHRFFIWGLGINGIRVLVLLLVITAVSRLEATYFTAFLVAVLTGYFIFLFSEVLYLHFSTRKS